MPVGKKQISILALDQASECGWAITSTIYGTWDMTTRKDESSGMKLIRFKAKLTEVHSAQKLDLIVYERPAGRNAHAIIHAAKLVGIVEEFCEANHIQYRAYSASEVKKFATGKGNASKDQMILAAKEKLGYTGDNHNEADALWIWTLAKHEYANKSKK